MKWPSNQFQDEGKIGFTRRQEGAKLGFTRRRGDVGDMLAAAQIRFAEGGSPAVNLSLP
jgi:hypothetical protein